MAHPSPTPTQRALVAVTLGVAAAVGAVAVAVLWHAHASGALALHLVSQATLTAGGVPLLAFRLLALGAILVTDVEILTGPSFTMAGTDMYGRTLTGIVVAGLRRFGTFTVWSWQLQGVYFAAVVAASLAPPSWALPGWLPVVAHVAFEISLPVSLLVTTIVTYVLYPQAAAAGRDVTFLFRWPGLLMHNANLAFMLVELFASGHPPLNPWHLPVVVLWGLAYVSFANLYATLGPGFFFYPFLAPGTRTGVAAHLALVTVLGVFYALCCGIQFVQPQVAQVGAVLLFSQLQVR
jgi:hypothetical protein